MRNWSRICTARWPAYLILTLSLSAPVKNNKKQRCFLHESLKGSSGYVWDHQPDIDASKQYGSDGVNKPVAC